MSWDDEQVSKGLDLLQKRRFEIERLRVLVAEAIEDLEHWAGYASDYFKEKHDLAGNVADLKSRIVMLDDPLRKGGGR